MENSARSKTVFPFYLLKIACIGTMQFKGLGAPNKYFAIETVCFQVQLEAGGYFLQEKFFAFATAASRASWYQLAIFESDFSNPTSKTLVELRPNPIFSKNIALTVYPRWCRISKFSWYRKTPVSIFTSDFSWKKPRRRTSARHYTSERMYEKEETRLRRSALSLWNRSGKDAIWIFLSLQILYRGKPHAHHDYDLL